MSWFCMHDNTPSDPKWIVIARRSKQPKAVVLAVWVALLDYANQQPKRGSLEGIDCEVIDAMLDLEDGTSEAVMLAMEDKGILADGRIANWEKRQFTQKETGNAKSSTERSRESRERKRNAMQRDATDCNADATDATPCNDNAAECNAMQRDATDIKRNNIKENNINPPLPPLGGSAAGEQGSASPARREEREDWQPSIEFSELRSVWNAEVIHEADQAGARAYRYLKRTGQWPGLGVILDDIMKRKASGYWRKGYEPGLETYLSTLGWTAPLENPRAQVQSFEQEEELRVRRMKERAAERDKQRALARQEGAA